MGVHQLEDHITKSLNALQQCRFDLVPREPGADWRDLPNKRVPMDDGRETKKLRYPYTKADGKRGVSSCATSTKKMGNAVPPPLVRALGLEIRKVLVDC